MSESDKIFETFPSNYKEALAMLYLKKQDLTDKTPEELCALYWETFYRISAVAKEAKKEAKTNHCPPLSEQLPAISL